jgi:comEA protein
VDPAGVLAGQWIIGRALRPHGVAQATPRFTPRSRGEKAMIQRDDKGPLRARGALCLALIALLLAPSLGLAAPSSGKASTVGVVNINTASAEELQQLPGVGSVRATAILATRKERGGFKSVDELMEVKGIGPSMLEKLRPRVTLKGRTTARPAGAAPPAAR